MNYFNYFSEIEELFIRRRGRNLLLSPLDWALIETWQERAVPLHVILSAIETVFDSADKQPARKKTIKSLTYCREEIEAQHAAWLERQTGKNGDGGKVRNPKPEARSSNSTDSNLFSDETIAAHVEKVSFQLKAARQKTGGRLGEVLDEAAKRLNALANDCRLTAENLEQSLEKLDASIDAALLSEAATDNLKAEIKRQLAGYRGRMETETYERTFDLMLLKRLRERAEIPRLGLFYL